ncbi:DEAD/DEAH box helicase family protein [Alphaproteobacteria bacterium]|nr:DEAD/DEAH box helicase family protein [Alphaproteobacteria bacterium]
MISARDFLNIGKKSRYELILDDLRKRKYHLDSIIKTVENSVENIKKKETRSFVIYGEPQSGKTEMMTTLTGKLLDEGFKFIVILLNDSLDLLRQNKNRFQNSKLTPTAQGFTKNLFANTPNIKDLEWIVFVKKNSQDLKKFMQYADQIPNKIIIDDEADYASPNSKINKPGERTKINDLILKLIGNDGIYIGVTATPARLDLNNTFENDNEKWVFFDTHPKYKGHDFFFPMKRNNEGYSLNLMKEYSNNPQRELKESLYRFLVNAAYLNLKKINNDQDEEKFIMLIHTSGKKADHIEDYNSVIEVFNILQSANGNKFESLVNDLIQITNKKFKDNTREIIEYILTNSGSKNIVLMNSDTDKQLVDFETGTEKPAAIFTISIGGNIVSRGVTFNNLLTMFFTREVKHKIQQDTYIQRARMFGNRGEYIENFELSIPEELYDNWHRCFQFHRIAYAHAISGKPAWLGDKKVRAVATSSIDKSTVQIDSGLINFSIFDYSKEIEGICLNKEIDPITKLNNLNKIIGDDGLPSFFIDVLKELMVDGLHEFAIHKPRAIDSYKSGEVDVKEITRKKGFFGTNDYNIFPQALHHMQIFFNAYGKGRFYYSFRSGNIQFLRNLIKH